MRNGVATTAARENGKSLGPEPTAKPAAREGSSARDKTDLSLLREGKRRRDRGNAGAL
jgi:hypothetical protein